MSTACAQSRTGLRAYPSTGPVGHGYDMNVITRPSLRSGAEGVTALWFNCRMPDNDENEPSPSDVPDADEKGPTP